MKCDEMLIKGKAELNNSYKILLEQNFCRKERGNWVINAKRVEGTTSSPLA